MDIEVVNRQAWRSAEVVRDYEAAQGWVDRGEEAALMSVADAVRGRRALDLGVGGGRTVPLMRLLTHDYVAVDYSPAMVELCRRNYPGVDVRLEDVRDLSALESQTFGLVTFSFNALDCLNHDDRRRALDEIRRVLHPDGWVVLSTLNLHGATYRRRPWQFWRLIGPVSHPLVRALVTLPFRGRRYALGFRNWWRLRVGSERHNGWAIDLLSAHEFRMLVHYTTLAQARLDMADAGFAIVAAFDNHGSQLDLGAPSSTDFFHLVLRPQPVA
jgi:SAM-dependent methyltransferase